MCLLRPIFILMSDRDTELGDSFWTRLTASFAPFLELIQSIPSLLGAFGGILVKLVFLIAIGGLSIRMVRLTLQQKY